ncbi:MAG TPA: radical SAM protein, partial [Sandaracinaceae bacterium]
MRLLLINPTIVDKPEHLHIGLTTVASYVRAHSHHHVSILDFVASRRSWERTLRERLEAERPDVVGMYISTPYLPAARRVAAAVRRLAPGVPIVAGGHHPTLAPDEVMECPELDMLIVGEGEKPMLRLLDALERGEPLSVVPGLRFRENGRVVGSPKDALLDAHAIPRLDWSLHDERTLREALRIWGILPFMASRGCPYRCSFCAITSVQRLYSGERFLRFRDPVEVVDELEEAYERYRDWGLRIVFFYDLNFLLRPDWVKAFTSEYRRRGMHEKLKWSAYSRGDHITPEVLESLKDSGCVNLRIGIEAANPIMRNDIYDKQLPQDVLERALRDVKALGISVTGYFIAGGPGERPEWLMESLDFAYRFGIEYPVFFLYKPLSGTDILDRAEELGSSIIEESMTRAADFLHGVNMRHRHLEAWQIELFVRATHVLFGAPLVWHQLRRAGWRYPLRMADYVRRGLALGFPPYAAFTYFVFYGDDHLSRPIALRERERPSLAWRAARGLLGALLGR